MMERKQNSEDSKCQIIQFTKIASTIAERSERLRQWTQDIGEKEFKKEDATMVRHPVLGSAV